MTTKQDIVFAWSSGKDSAMGLGDIMEDERYNVVSLLTTVTDDYDRVSMHGVRRVLARAQADSIGLPLREVGIRVGADNSEYEKKMKTALLEFKERGVTAVAFADIFLEDLRQYREENLAKVGMSGVFPLWKIPTTELSRRFVDQGFKAVITCVDTKVLAGDFSGRSYDESFLADLPEGVDPCGEYGEFHSFSHGGPIFKKPISFSVGERVLRDDRFMFTDLIPD